MDPLLAFLGTIVLVSFIIPRLGPFLSLVITAIFYGLLTNMGTELMGYVITGSLPILC
jgi:H+/gluconate symporter-like permease